MLKKWITGKDLKRRWGINTDTLIHWLEKTDLKAHWPQDFGPIDDEDVSWLANRERAIEKNPEMKSKYDWAESTLEWKKRVDWPGFDNLIYEEKNVISIEKEYVIQPTMPTDIDQELDGKEKKNVFPADEKDFIHTQEVVKIYGIGIGQQINFLDAGKLTAYERLPGKRQAVYLSMDPDKWQKITGKGIPDPWPEEGLNVPIECKAEYRPLHINEIGKLTSEKVKELYFLRSEIEALEKSKQPVTTKPKQTKWELLASTIKLELDENPDLPEEPEKLQEEIFMASSVRGVLRKRIQCGIPHAKRELSKRGLLDPRLKAKGGRGKTVPK